jgi:hypothetical protein
MNIYFFSNRDLQQSVASTAPILCDYEALRSQFRWLTDDDVESLIEENLEKEITPAGGGSEGRVPSDCCSLLGQVSSLYH